MTDRILRQLDSSTCNFLAVKTVTDALLKAGFTRLDMASTDWNVKPNGRYFLTRNSSALFAFIMPENTIAEPAFRIIAAHTDSPCFKIKPNAEIYGDGGVISLNVEKYGGGILYTWFDRPLSISGRVMLRGEDALHPREVLVDLRRPVALIPHLAIHFNRAVNEGNPLSVQKDMLPVVGYYTPEQIADIKAKGGIVKIMLADYLDIKPADIIEYELNLYPAERAALAGANNEYIQSGRIDDLSMCFAGLEALLASADTPASYTRVLALFDNEETGSGTKQGAASTFLYDVLHRIAQNVCPGDEDFHRAVASSFMFSADNAHAVHPNHPEHTDVNNCTYMNKGVVIKTHAGQKYTSDGMSVAVARELAARGAAAILCKPFR